MIGNRISVIIPLAAGVLAFLVRLLYLAEFRRSVFFSTPILDAAWHHQWATRLAEGHLLDGAPYFRAPLYSWFLALIYALGGADSWIPRLVQAGLAGLAGGGLAFVAGRLSSPRIGLLSGLIFAVYGPLVFSTGEILHEALLVPLMVLLLIFLVRGQEELTDRDAGALPWFLGGLTLGISAIARPNVLALLPAAVGAPWILRPAGMAAGRPRRILFPVLAGVILPILPVTAVNFIPAGDLVWIASQGGINFYAGNNSLADGRHVAIPELKNSGGWEDFLPRIKAIAEEAKGRPLRPNEVSNYWFQRGVSWLKANPWQALELYGLKLRALISGYEAPNNRDIYVARRDSLLLSLLVGRAGPFLYPWGLLVPLALLGFLTEGDRKRLYFCGSFAFLLGLSLFPFFICDRFRLAMVPFLIIPAAIGIDALPRLWKKPRENRGRWALVLAALVLANLDPGARTQGDSADAWHKLGEALYNRGDFEAAVEAFDRALAIAPSDVSPRLGRAYAFEAMGQDSLAEPELKVVSELLPDSWLAQYGYGKHLLTRGRPAEAVPFLEKAASLMPDRALVHRDLGFAYEASGNNAAAGLALSHALRLGEESAELHLSLGLVAFRQGSPEFAENNWKRALELDSKHFRSLYNLGLLKFGQGRDEEARELWRRAESAQPQNPLIPIQRARMAMARSEKEEARKALESAFQRGYSPAEALADSLLRPLLR